MTKIWKILAINTGSTSTKIALYENEKAVYVKNIGHSMADLSRYNNIADQYEMRKEAVLSVLDENRTGLADLSAVVGRGGLLPPVKSGAYEINGEMIDRLVNRPVVEHASNLSAIIAYEIVRGLNIPAYIYDPITVDELEPVARITGMPEIERRSLIHALNMRAAAIKTAEKMGRPYPETTLIIVHIGGGISLSLHKNGRMIDILADDDGPFSMERAGRIPDTQMADLCYSGKYDLKTMYRKLRGKGGITAHLGTNSAVEVEERIARGDERAKLIYRAMAYQIAKGIGELSTVVKGGVDRIVITGGVAYSKMLTGWIRESVEFIAPVDVIPGENELEALAMGTLRVLRGQEKAYVYDLK